MYFSTCSLFCRCCYLFVLIGRYCDENDLAEHKRIEHTVSKTRELVCFDYMQAWLIFVHGVKYDLLFKKKKRLNETTRAQNINKKRRCCIYVSVLIHGVVGEFHFVKQDRLLHPLNAHGRRVGMDVEACGSVRLGLACHIPLGVCVLVAVLISWNDVDQ